MENTRKVIFCKDCEYFTVTCEHGTFCTGKCRCFDEDAVFCGEDFCSHARERKTLKTIYQKYPENNQRR